MSPTRPLAVPVRAPREPTPDSRLGLSRPRIVAAGLALLDRDGLDAFSMRRLAQELGVGTMTLYSYFRRRDELLDAIVDTGSAVILELLADAATQGPWRERLRELMVGVRRAHIEHPAIVELRYKRPLLSPGALEVTETGVRILREAGLGRREAVSTYRMLFVYTFGYSAFGPGPGSAAEREQALAALRALPPDRFPTLVDLAEEAADTMADQGLFEVGLDALLDGLERRLQDA